MTCTHCLATERRRGHTPARLEPWEPRRDSHIPDWPCDCLPRNFLARPGGLCSKRLRQTSTTRINVDRLLLLIGQILVSPIRNRAVLDISQSAYIRYSQRPGWSWYGTPVAVTFAWPIFNTANFGKVECDGIEACGHSRGTCRANWRHGLLVRLHHGQPRGA